MRAMASAVLHLGISIFAAGIVPQVIGILNDLLSGRFGDEAVRYSLGLVLLTNLWGAIHAFLAVRSIRDDFAAVGTEEATTVSTA
jgi:hypothetical protein